MIESDYYKEENLDAFCERVHLMRLRWAFYRSVKERRKVARILSTEVEQEVMQQYRKMIDKPVVSWQ